jgi:hypothetical protein
MKTTVFLCTDAYNDRPVAVFKTAAAAAKYAEREGCFVDAALLRDGPLVYVDAFWEAVLDLETGEVATERVSRYKFGSAKEPCRHGVSFAGRVASQNLGTAVAWGATEQEALDRAAKTSTEAKKRAARDKAYDAVVQPYRDAVGGGPRNDGKGFRWDPYGLWMHEFPGLHERATEAAEEAYASVR